MRGQRSPQLSAEGEGGGGVWLGGLSGGGWAPPKIITADVENEKLII